MRTQERSQAEARRKPALILCYLPRYTPCTAITLRRRIAGMSTKRSPTSWSGWSTVIWIVLLGSFALSVLCCAFYVLGAGVARRSLREGTDNWTHPPPEEATDRDR